VPGGSGIGTVVPGGAMSSLAGGVTGEGRSSRLISLNA